MPSKQPHANEKKAKKTPHILNHSIKKLNFLELNTIHETNV